MRMKAGIGMVHQHFMLVDTFTVLENVVLGAEGGRAAARGLDAARREVERLGREYGLRVDPDALVGSLPVGEQQRVEIIKALYRGAGILILDEPSAVLTPQETDQLFDILRTLRERGVTVILITHKLREIMAVTDAVYVMRHGEVVAQRRTADTTREELAELMVGRKVRLELDKSAPRPGKPALIVEACQPARCARRHRAGRSTSRCTQARSSGSPACRATGRASCSMCSPGSGRRRPAVSSSASVRSPPRTRPIRPRCARLASPTFPKTDCDRPRRQHSKPTRVGLRLP